MNIAAVTICSGNYVAKAIVLAKSYHEHHPYHQFYLVVANRKSDDLVKGVSGVELIWAEDLGIQKFLQYAFMYDIIELNTNIKPFVLEHLLQTHAAVIYLDPDIYVCAPMDPVLEALECASFVVTPHYTTALLDGCKPDDLDLLRFGPFNLGFIGIRQCAESLEFLRWWRERCFEFGFYEPETGLAVDQKWVSLAPCFFPGMRVLADLGLNVAFWNLHERRISRTGTTWMVNGHVPLRFIHFSSFDSSHPDNVGEKQDRFAPGSRPDFELLAREYAVKLCEQERIFSTKVPYGYDCFDDGARISPALRRCYAGLRQKGCFADVKDPFDAKGRIRVFAKKRGLMVRGSVTQRRLTFRDLHSFSWQVKAIHILLRLVLFVIGPVRYGDLMRYMGYICAIRHQVSMFGEVDRARGERLHSSDEL
jgi:hypothetical protein